MSEPDKNEPFDFAAEARKKLELPDKRLGLLWGDLLQVLDGMHEGDVDASLGRLAHLAFRSLQYASHLQGELRSRVEMLEFAAGISYTEALFPPSGSDMRPGTMSIPSHLDEIYSRLAALESAKTDS